jgi:hypothetical protein
MVTTMFRGADQVEVPSAHEAKVETPGIPQTIAQYEILAQPVAPVQNVPYIQQGFFVQVANLQTTLALVTLNFQSTPPISNSPIAPIRIFADYITNDGNPVFYNAFFSPPVGFSAIPVPANGSVIFGVQYVYNPQTTSPELLGTTPQQSASSRGIVTFSANLAGRYGILPTIRQVFTTFDSNLNPVGFSSSAYAVPLINLVNV